ncbi:MAG: helix-turn-helix transcriptional regulator [Spirochaetota bacterium]|nr:helix-turn-helix transcriptional regulator [Spirochaetota bacterium]
MTSEEEFQLKTLGKRLRNYRIKKGFSQESFAEKTQLDRTYISGLERGKRNPSFLIIRRISKVLEISEQQLFESGNIE